MTFQPKFEMAKYKIGIKKQTVPLIYSNIFGLIHKVSAFLFTLLPPLISHQGPVDKS